MATNMNSYFTGIESKLTRKCMHKHTHKFNVVQHLRFIDNSVRDFIIAVVFIGRFLIILFYFRA